MGIEPFYVPRMMRMKQADRDKKRKQQVLNTAGLAHGFKHAGIHGFPNARYRREQSRICLCDIRKQYTADRF